MNFNVFKKCILIVCLVCIVFGPVKAETGLIYRIEVHDLVERILRAYLIRAIDEAEADNADLIIIDIETPGGFVHETYKIVDPLLQTSIPTVAWIHNDAISAGSLIAFACDDIVMADGGAFGAAVPYSVGVDEKMKISLEVDKKFQSVFLKQYISVAHTNGHDVNMARAMVTSDHDDISYEDYGVEPLPYGETGRRKVKVEEDEKRPWILKLAKGRGSKEDENKHFLCQRGEILTLTTEEAKAFGVVLKVCNSIDDILALDKFQHLVGSRIVTATPTWSEAVAKFLSSPLMTVLLLVGAIMGISTELKIPGFGVPGILGISCQMLLFFGRLGVGAAQWTDLILVIIGVALLGIEIFVIPGFGIVGALGIVAVVAGIFMMLYDSGIDVPMLRGGSVATALFQMMIGIMAGIVGIYVVFRFAGPTTPVFGKLILGNTENSSVGYTADRTAAEEVEELIGKFGKAKSTLRPSGKAIFDNTLYDVVTQGDAIEAGESIRIIEIKGNRIVVEKAPEEQQS